MSWLEIIERVVATLMLGGLGSAFVAMLIYDIIEALDP